MLAVLGAACAQEGSGPGGGASTYSVIVDGKGTDLNTNFFAFFPKTLKAHPGETVRFDVAFTGDPHTVTLGTLVNAGLAAAAKAKPGTNPAQIPEMMKLPPLAPPPPATSANQSAMQPCFLESGAPPPSEPCERIEQPAFTGKESFYNSGWLDQDESFDVELASDVAPGKYSFMCLVHRAPMSGTIEVVDADTKIPTPQDVEQAGRQELNDSVAKLQAAVDTADASAQKAFAGVGSPEVKDGIASVFLPEDVSIPVGGSVTWTVVGPHTITFGLDQETTEILSRNADGTVVRNTKLRMPAISKGFAPATEAKLYTLSEEWNGEGYFNTGVIASRKVGNVVLPGFPSAGFAYSLKFTRAGTYKFHCGVHLDMVGRVKVG